MPEDVARFRDCDQAALARLLGRFGLGIAHVEDGQDIPGSYWGDSEAGITPDSVVARPDTPVHSILHEACHFICMDPARRDALGGERGGTAGDAGGDYDEENAVCYLQILLAAELPGMSRQSMCRDMDRWGYTFRLGSAQAWFEHDASDAAAWLRRYGLIDRADRLSYRLRPGPEPAAGNPS